MTYVTFEFFKENAWDIFIVKVSMSSLQLICTHNYNGECIRLLFLFLHRDKGGDQNFFPLAHWFKSFCWRLPSSTSKKKWKHCFCFSYHHFIQNKIVTQISFHPFFQLPMDADKYFCVRNILIFCAFDPLLVKLWIESIVWVYRLWLWCYEKCK